EDGIRDYKVTGVQTCALPIWKFATNCEISVNSPCRRIAILTFERCGCRKHLARLSTTRPARAIILRGLWCHRRVDLRGRLMARRQSRMLPLGTAAPRFALRDTMSGRTVALQDFVSSPALLIAFMCNHCPFVKHIL